MSVRLIGGLAWLLAADEMPEPGQAVHSTIGYHIRPGPHDLTAYDWWRYLDFADRHLGSPQPPRQPPNTP